MEIGETPAAALKKTTLTPKAIIYQKFGSKACYTVEEVQEDTQNICPGLAIQQKGPCLFRCRLQLPEFSVVSETFKKKKDAEQSASQMALEKLSIPPATDNPIVQDPWDDLVGRVSHLFSSEFLSSPHPLSGHFRAAVRREGDYNGLIPVSVIAESNPSLAISLVMKAAARLSGSVAILEGQLWVRRHDPYPPEIVQSLGDQQSSVPESIWTEAICIPCSLEKTVEPLTLNVFSNGYYLDVIAQKLGVADASRVLVSRTIGKASSETRLYSSVPESYLLDMSSDLLNVNEAVHFEGSFNARASYFSGQDVYGDAIMASIGYKWNSTDLFHEDLSLKSYYRMLISKIPVGIYKLSREAILTAELPVVFTTRTNWRGSFPRDLLCTFCRQHRLSEPVFSTVSTLKASSELSGSRKKLKVTESTTEEEAECANRGGTAASDRELAGSGGTFRCEVKIFSKCQDLIIECSPKDSHKKQSDAIQNASLKVLSWLNTYFKEPDMPTSSADVLGIRFHHQNFFKEFALCLVYS
ncbi:hypothetical protein L1049_009977 [Liquidambar formosana]|uniref:Uncharacterized protein n=1 Tax=Liquidambar formosana TaxID=63359 RepID=A0AAP0NA79_LIQFO